jgi:NADPH:quinone reductase-like Zn-dependent oxidoreductase
MKAIVFSRYGSPDVLELKEVEKPTPKDNEVLVRVHAASINDWDWEALHGSPFVNRLIFGLLRPTKHILGSDIAGRIEAVGKNVVQFQLGDEVFGDLSGDWGGFAEYVCARESALALKAPLWPWIRMTTNKHIRLVVLKPNKGLATIKELFEAGKVLPVIDGPYKLSEVPTALRHFGEGRHKGKVVITLSSQIPLRRRRNVTRAYQLSDGRLSLRQRR